MHKMRKMSVPSAVHDLHHSEDYNLHHSEDHSSFHVLHLLHALAARCVAQYHIIDDSLATAAPLPLVESLSLGVLLILSMASQSHMSLFASHACLTDLTYIPLFTI